MQQCLRDGLGNCELQTTRNAGHARDECDALCLCVCVSDFITFHALRMYVQCMYVCMYMCMYVCMYIHTISDYSKHTYIHTYICVVNS
jgi:hypothetical protein